MKRQREGRGRHSVPAAELELLALLERHGECAVADLRQMLAPQRPLARASVITLLRRLEHKGMVRRRPAPHGRAHLYLAAGKSGLALHLRSLVARVFGHDRMRLVAALFEGGPPTPEELADLERLVAELREREGSGERQ
jgi:predicted transcriptional regulator